jgi:hypothetical protein
MNLRRLSLLDFLSKSGLMLGPVDIEGLPG